MDNLISVIYYYIVRNCHSVIIFDKLKFNSSLRHFVIFCVNFSIFRNLIFRKIPFCFKLVILVPAFKPVQLPLYSYLFIHFRLRDRLTLVDFFSRYLRETVTSYKFYIKLVILRIVPFYDYFRIRSDKLTAIYFASCRNVMCSFFFKCVFYLSIRISLVGGKWLSVYFKCSVLCWIVITAKSIPIHQLEFYRITSLYILIQLLLKKSCRICKLIIRRN